MAVADATGDAMVVAVGLHSKKNSFLNVKRTVLRHVAAGKEVTTANDLVSMVFVSPSKCSELT